MAPYPGVYGMHRLEVLNYLKTKQQDTKLWVKGGEGGYGVVRGKIKRKM